MLALAYSLFFLLALSTLPTIDCLQRAKSASVHVSRLVKCPCLVHVSRYNTAPNATLPPTSFDLLVVTKDQWYRAPQSAKTLGATDFLPQHSLFNVSGASLVRDDGWFHHLEPHKVDHPADLLVLLRPSRRTVDVSDYILRIEPFTLRSEECPIVLKPNQPRQPGSLGVNPPTGPDVIQPRIVGGDFANRRLFPYMVVLYSPERIFCSGVLLSRYWVATAAHCRVNENFTVSVGVEQAFVGEPEVNIVRAYNNPSYSRYGALRQNDIAVFKMGKPAPPGSRFMPIDTGIPENGEFLRAAGYGFTSYSGEAPDPFPASLRQVDVPVTRSSNCKITYRDSNNVISQKKQICAGYFDKGGCDAWYVLQHGCILNPN